MGILTGILALAIVATAGGLWFRAIRAVRIPENRSAFVAVCLGGAVLAAASLAGASGWAARVPAGLALAGGLFFLMTVAISRQKVGEPKIAVGSAVPAFSAVDENGAVFDSSSLGGHPALIKFFRGHW